MSESLIIDPLFKEYQLDNELGNYLKLMKDYLIAQYKLDNSNEEQVKGFEIIKFIHDVKNHHLDYYSILYGIEDLDEKGISFYLNGEVIMAIFPDNIHEYTKKFDGSDNNIHILFPSLLFKKKIGESVKHYNFFTNNPENTTKLHGFSIKPIY